MKHKLVRYKVKPEAAAENRRLIEAVFDALKARSPKDFGYMVVELGDGSFIHLVTDLGDAAFELGGLPEVQAFRRGIAVRCDEPPQASDAQIVGLYGGVAG
jgi:hypothetical protein